MIKPISDYITVEAPEKIDETRTASGLYMPTSERKDFEVAKVLEVGSEVKDIKKGDNVVFLKVGSTEFENVLIMKADNVLALKK